MAHLSINNLCKSFGNLEVLKDINLEINTGEFVVFVGPSGCGKSTLLRCISGLEPITTGELKMDGKVVNDVSPSKRNMAMVFQSYALYPHMTVYQNIAYPLKLAKMRKPDIEQRVQETAQKLHLTELLDRHPRALSGGQRQRVAIGRSIVRDPQVFLFDEPLSNLDASLRVQMRMEIAELHASLSETTMIYVTHDQVEAMTMADRIVVLKDGEIKQVGTPLELYESPKSLFVAQFIGSPKMNLMTGEMAEGFPATTVGVRPEHLEITKDGIWTGEVVYSENLGSDTYIYVNVGTDESVIIRLEGRSNYRSGDVVNFSPKDKDYHLFDDKGLPIKG